MLLLALLIIHPISQKKNISSTCICKYTILFACSLSLSPSSFHHNKDIVRQCYNKDIFGQCYNMNIVRQCYNKDIVGQCYSKGIVFETLAMLVSQAMFQQIRLPRSFASLLANYSLSCHWNKSLSSCPMLSARIRCMPSFPIWKSFC